MAHLELSFLQPGDVVLGTLPVSMVSELTAMGVRYLHLELRTSEALRGSELTADDMEKMGARLQEYRACSVELPRNQTLACPKGI